MDSRPAPSAHPGMTNKDRFQIGNTTMALVFTEEQSMLRDSARGLISDKAPVSHLRHLRDAKDPTGFSKEFWPKISNGSLLATLAIDEGAKHRPLQTSLQAVRAGNGFKLSGAKALVVDGHVADLLIVAARTAGSPGEREGLTLFLVNPKAKGVAIERTIMVDAHNAARIELANVEVNADSVLGEVDQGAGLLDGVLDIGRGAVASEMVGLSEEVFNRTVAYLKSRKQFGKLIGEFQALQHRAAELYVDIEITRAAVMKALQALDSDVAKASSAVAVAKAR